MFRLAWALGLKPPPPPFLSFWANFLWIGGLTALLILGVRAWVWWNHPDALTAVGTVISLTLPVVFGAVFAALWRRQARGAGCRRGTTTRRRNSVGQLATRRRPLPPDPRPRAGKGAVG